MKQFYPIPNWIEKKLTCTKCKTKLSVKYQIEGNPYCNRCVLPACVEEGDK
jgi:LIM domain.